jgi:SAM-dependent MidA family methyltransferase
MGTNSSCRCERNSFSGDWGLEARGWELGIGAWEIADFRLRLADVIRERGPMTVAAFMNHALYDSEFGYYARAPQRSGRAGDFFTSVDVGPLFGELLEVQLSEMADILKSTGLPQLAAPHSQSSTIGDSSNGDGRSTTFDFVEAGAGNGRLSTDVLRAAQRRDPDFFERIRLHLVEASPSARQIHQQVLGDVVDRLASSSAVLPDSFEGVLVANELLDALPTHQVVMREDGLREIYVDVATRVSVGADGRQSKSDLQETGTTAGAATTPDAQTLLTREGAPSTPALADYLERLGITLEPGWRAEINLQAVDWVRQAARRLRRGFMILIDYGHEARELYSATHDRGTLTSFAGHVMAGPESDVGVPPWLERPGDQDLTTHVDFSSVRAAAKEEGLDTLGFLDQTYFLLGLGAGTEVRPGANVDQIKHRLALKTLLMPGGLGSTHKVLILGKGVGKPALRGCSFGQRVT